MPKLTKILALLPLAMLLSANVAIAIQCPPEKGVALQVLGSGGPIADDDRASASYLLWVDGRSRALIDAGGGAFLRFSEASAKFTDLDFIGLSHFHADHSSDFPALLKSGYFAARERELAIAGPDSAGPFPGLMQFLRSLFDRNSGAFAYLGGYLDGTGGLPRLAATEIKSAHVGPMTVFADDESKIQVDALHVPHGIVPALAFRVRVDNQTFVFASDQNGSKDEFIDFARRANILVMHMPIAEDATGVARQLHAPPSVLGDIAQSADVQLLVVSHIMSRSESDLVKHIAKMQSRFDGRIEIANDLDCFLLEQQE